MLAVIFEAYPAEEGLEEYLEIAAELRGFLEGRDGFISIERFQSLNDEGKVLSLSFWRDAASIEAWRNLLEHRNAQQQGRSKLFRDYRIRVAEVLRDYSAAERDQAPADSRDALR